MSEDRDELYEAFSSQLRRDEPDAAELAPYLPALADGLRQALLDERPAITGMLLRWGHRIGCPCDNAVDAGIAFMAAMDDDDLARYFGRWLRESGLKRFVLEKALRPDDECEPG